MRRETPRILHVTESMGGGTAGAIVEFVRSTPQFEHHLLFRRRAGSDLPVRHEDLFAGSRDAGGGPVRLARALRETLPAVAPRVVHLHATWAGLVGRTVIPAIARSATGPAILFTPHGFSFERTGVPPLATRLLRAFERAVAASTDLAVCVSPREADLATDLGIPAVVVPNTTRARTARPDRRRHDGSIVTVGRVCPQKDPAFLLRVKALHTAAWESCPLPLLEAAAAGLPLVARSIPALDSLGLDPDLGTAEAVAAELATVLTTGRPGRPRLQEAFAARHAPQAQAAALADAYASVLGPIAAPPLTRVG